MDEAVRFTLSKEERISSKRQIDRLFGGGGSRSITSYPIRAVYLLERTDGENTPVSILASVPKKCFKRAVKRNRVKRQLREAYRKNKHSIINKVNSLEGMSLMIAFIWMENKLYDSKTVEQKIKNLLQRIEEKVRHEKGREQTIQP
ncbi:MAG: ribonuclease P protein component [Prevotella sp.]